MVNTFHDEYYLADGTYSHRLWCLFRCIPSCDLVRVCKEEISWSSRQSFLLSELSPLIVKEAFLEGLHLIEEQ